MREGFTMLKTKIRDGFTMDQDQDKRRFYYGSRWEKVLLWIKMREGFTMDQDERRFYYGSRWERVLLWIKMREGFTMDQDQDKRMFYYGSR